MESKSTQTKINLHNTSDQQLQNLAGNSRIITLNHNRFLSLSKAIVLITVFLLAPYTLINGQSPYTSVASGNWNSDATWSGTGIPVAGDIVNIANGHTITVTADAACTSITFPAGNTSNSTVILSSGVTLAVSGNITIPRAGSIGGTNYVNTVAVGAGTLNVGGNLAFTTGGTAMRHQVTISSGTATVTGNVVGSTGNTSGTISFSGAGILRLGGTIFIHADGTLTTFTGSTVEYYASAAQTVGDFDYNNLTLSGSGVKTLPAAATIGGNLTLNGTASVTTAAALAIGGNLTVGSGTAFTTGATNTWILGVAGITSVSGILNLVNTGTKTFSGNVTIANGGLFNETGTATINFAGNLQNDGAFNANTGNHTFTGTAKTISGANAVAIPNLTISGMTTNNGSLTVSTTLTGASTLSNGATGILNIGGTSTITTLTANTVGNLVNYTGGVQACKVTTYDNLTLSGSGAKTFATTPTVNGVLSMGGTASVVVTTGVVTYGANATLQYNKPAAYTATSEEWITPFAGTGGVIIANTGAITMDGAKVFNASVPLTINSLATLVSNNNQLTFGGNFVNSGTFTAGSSPIVIANTMLVQSIAGLSTTGLISMTKTAGTATFQGNVTGVDLTFNGIGGTLNLGTALTHTFTGIITLTEGTINGGSSTFRLGGSVVDGTNVTFTAATGTVEWNAAGPQTIPGGDYYNLIFSGSGEKSITDAATTVTGNLSIAAGAKANVGANLNIPVGTLTLGGSNTISGTWGSTASAATSQNDTYFASTNGIVTVSLATGIRDMSVKSGLTLRNYPNPFVGNTSISYALPYDGHVTIIILNMSGQVVKTVVNEMGTQGEYNLNIETGDLKPGVYMATVSLKTGGKEMVKTIRLVKGK
jgi:hypothetical protein